MMKKAIIILSLLAVTFFAALPALAETIAKIVAVVNDQIITATEFNDRLTLVLTASTIPDTQETRQKMGPQILRNLIEEQLRLQEALRQKIVINDDEIKAAFAQVAEQNKMQGDQFEKELRKSGVNPKTLKDQLKAQIGWAKLVRERLSPKVQVTPQDIDAFLARLRANIGKPQYLLAEIVLPIDDPSQENDVVQFSHKLIDDMKKGAHFSAVARQVSQSSTARNGGDLGWIGSGELPKELDAALSTLPVGQLSDPIRTPRGYTILLLREKRDITEDNLPKREDAANVIGNQKLDVLQRRLLRDVRNDAIIDVRL